MLVLVKYGIFARNCEALMCTTNMGGSGNVAVLSSAHRMELLPFAQIVTRSCGALMLTLGGILVQMVG